MTASLIAPGAFLCPDTHAIAIGDSRRHLTAQEFILLSTLLKRPGRTYEFRFLLDQLDRCAFHRGGQHCIPQLVKRLKKKLAGSPVSIRAERRVGYVAEVAA